MTMLLPHDKGDLRETSSFATLLGKLRTSALYEPVFISDHFPRDPTQRYTALALLKKSGLPVRCMLYTYSPGGSVPNLHFAWTVPQTAGEDEITNRTVEIVESLNDQCPQYMTRQTRKDFVSKFGRVTNVILELSDTYFIFFLTTYLS